MNIYLTSTAPAITASSEKCTRCGSPWSGIQIDHLMEYRCRCGYSARETFGGLGDYSEQCARAMVHPGLGMKRTIRTTPHWLDH